MPVDPSDGEALAGRVLPVVAQAEQALLALVAGALGDDRDGSGGWDNPDTAAWAQAKLARLRFLQEQVAAGTASMAAELEAVAVDLVRQAYDVGAGLALADLDAAPAATLPATAATVVESGAVTAGALAVRSGPAVVDLSARLRAVRDVVAPRLVAAYQDAVAAGAREVLGGAVTRRAASQHVLDRLGADGVKGFTDRAGRSWSLETYAEMATRTAVGQAAVDGHVETLQAAGLDLVMVSDAPRECPLCRPYEGRVLSLSGVTGAVILPSATDGRPTTVRVAATLDEARRAGFQHPNCRHRLVAYLPGATRLPRRTADPAGYEATQRQRALERKVREWKRREAVALDEPARAAARAKVRAWQVAIREHVDANDLKRLSAREQIGRAI